MSTIPVKHGTIVKLRENRSGRVTSQKAIVVGNAPSDNYSRAYGRQVYYCTVYGKDDAHIGITGAGDLYPIARARRVPAICKRALVEFEQDNPSLARRKRKKR